MKNYYVERLRRDLIDYYGAAMNNGLPMAVIELSKIENATDEEIIEIAREIGINLNRYIEDMER